MFCERCFELVKELERAQDNIFPFNADAVRAIIDEIHLLYNQNVAAANDDKKIYSLSEPNQLLRLFAWRNESADDLERGSVSGIAIRHAAIERNKRCLMAYAYNRLLRIRQVRWEFGSILPPEIKVNLCEPEIQWFNGYSKILATYMRAIGGKQGLNLSQDLKPPKSLNVKVHCLVDFGKFELDTGEVVLLKKNSVHYMSRAQCEPLIIQGILEHVKD